MRTDSSPWTTHTSSSVGGWPMKTSRRIRGNGSSTCRAGSCLAAGRGRGRPACLRAAAVARRSGGSGRALRPPPPAPAGLVGPRRSGCSRRVSSRRGSWSRGSTVRCRTGSMVTTSPISAAFHTRRRPGRRVGIRVRARVAAGELARAGCLGRLVAARRRGLRRPRRPQRAWPFVRGLLSAVPLNVVLVTAGALVAARPRLHL